MSLSDLSPPVSDPLFEQEALAATLAELVRIDSVNPAHDGPAGGERRVLEWIARWLEGHGFAPRIIEAQPGKPILRVRMEGQNPGPPLLFESHVDTVSIKGMTIEPFAAAVHDGRLWGRGSTDAKGQGVAMLHALASWKQSGRTHPCAIEIALVCDEEFGFSGARELLRDGVRARGIVVGEPTGLRVVAAHKGAVRFGVIVEGRLAHAARPELGVNAISAAAVLIQLINEMLIPNLAHKTAPLLRPATLNIATIEGGQQPNLVPDFCRIELERRLLPGETGADARREVEALFALAEKRFAGFRARLDASSLEASAFQTEPASGLVAAAGRATAALGFAPEPVGVDYCTDASTLVAVGAPMIVAGPGSIDQAHTADEFIELADLQAGARFYAALMGWDGQ